MLFSVIINSTYHINCDKTNNFDSNINISENILLTIESYGLPFVQNCFSFAMIYH